MVRKCLNILKKAITGTRKRALRIDRHFWTVHFADALMIGADVR
jgi:hypothetical protein